MLLTDTLVLLNGRSRNDERYELAFGWECTRNRYVCQAKRVHLFKFRLTPPEKFANVNYNEI